MKILDEISEVVWAITWPTVLILGITVGVVSTGWLCLTFTPPILLEGVVIALAICLLAAFFRGAYLVWRNRNGS